MTTKTKSPNELEAVPCSEFQITLLRSLAKNQTGRQIAGRGMAKWLSVANALCRRGLVASCRTGSFFVTDAGRKWLNDNPPNIQGEAQPPAERPTPAVKQDQRPQKGGWAPGLYQCQCIRCRSAFLGDKRAIHCADCAYSESSPAVHLEPKEMHCWEAEDCTRCGEPTRHWSDPHTPLCQSCASKPPTT